MIQATIILYLGLFLVYATTVSADTFLVDKTYKQVAFNINTESSPSRPKTLQAKGQDTAIDESFSNYVENLMKQWNITGLSLAIVKQGEDTEFGNWGNKTEDGEKMTSETQFIIASCSKAFLAASMGILIDDFATGKNSTPLSSYASEFDWTTKIKDLIPKDWMLHDEWASKKANIIDILSHVSGLPRHDLSYGPFDSSKDLVRNLRHLRPTRELREAWQYNNQMFTTSAYIISQYTGSYVDFVRDRIFHPLGMNSSTFSPTLAAGGLTQSWTAHKQRIPTWFTSDIGDLMAGAGGVITSTNDLSKWLKLLLNSGINTETNETLISRSSFEAITTAHSIIYGQPRNLDSSITSYGMGWLRVTYQGHEILLHSGAVPGFSTIVAFLPNDGLGIACLINTADRPEVNNAILFTLIGKILNLDDTWKSAEPRPISRPPRPKNASLPLSMSSYTGTYESPGYGSFTLCDSAGNSFYCNEVISAFKSVDASDSFPLPPEEGTPQLYGEWPRIWSTHVRLMHWNNNIFNLSATALFPKGYGASNTPFETYEMDFYIASVEFGSKDGKITGFGLTYLGSEFTLSPGEKRVDAWFRRV